MKIKLNIHANGKKIGDIVEAAVSPTKSAAYFFDDIGNGWYLTGPDFELVADEYEEASKLKAAGIREALGLRELLGQDVSKLVVDFK